MNVLIVIVLKPYFFSITNVSYQLNGIFIISDAIPIIPKNISEIMTGFAGEVSCNVSQLLQILLQGSLLR